MSDLLKINVNEHTEKKGQLTYLSWAWAWAEVLKIDPLADWTAHEYELDGHTVPFMRFGGTAMVKVSVKIKGMTRACLLPVMDHRNKAIQEPDSMQVNTAVMRCLAKAIAMHGLGLYIYAGEDLPEGDDKPEDDETHLAKTLKASIKANDDKKRTGVAADYLATVPPLTAMQKENLNALAIAVENEFNAYGVQGAYERIQEQGLDATERIYLGTQMASGIRNKITAFSREQKATA